MPKLVSALALVVVFAAACTTPNSYQTSGGGQSSSADGITNYKDPGQAAKTKKAFETPRF